MAEKILLVNVDSRWNMAIRKMYNYYKDKCDVEMIDLCFSGYPHKKTKEIDAAGFDKVFVSNIFEINADRVKVINCDEVVFGGIGSRNPHLQLPCEIENTAPYYFPEEDTSYGFITRGCIRYCWFCKVPKYEGKLKEFAERLKNEIISDTAYGHDTNQHSGYYDYQIKIGDIPEYIDNLVAEMVGDTDE